MNLTQLLNRPLITEKTLDTAKGNRYSFLVGVGAAKHQIKQAVETAFKVNVVKINTLTYKGVRKRTGRRRLATTTPKFKKALVTLKSGQTIALFEAKGQP